MGFGVWGLLEIVDRDDEVEGMKGGGNGEEGNGRRLYSKSSWTLGGLVRGREGGGRGRRVKKTG